MWGFWMDDFPKFFTWGTENVRVVAALFPSLWLDLAEYVLVLHSRANPAVNLGSTESVPQGCGWSHQLILLVFSSENLHSIGSAPLSINLLKFWTLICFQIEQLKFFMFLFDKMIMTKLKMWIALVLPSWYGSWQSPPYCCGRRWCTPAWGDSWRRRRWCSAPTPRPRVSPGSPAGWCRTLSIIQFGWGWNREKYKKFSRQFCPCQNMQPDFPWKMICHNFSK